MSVRPDNRLETEGLTAVACNACGAEVFARKSTWDQTSIQWTSQALSVCRERTDDRTRNDPWGRFSGCGALRDSIREAAVAGRLHIVQD
ncbi:MAG: ferredoxin [Tetrasphaera sp.]|nr:ferredoxin [Tetrasphaera sp.]